MDSDNKVTFERIDKLNNSVPYTPIGVGGLHETSGLVQEEFLPELIGKRGMRVYKQMSTNDPTIGALMFSIEQKLKNVEWEVHPHENLDGSIPTQEQQKYASLLYGMLFKDMEITWDDFISQALSEIVYGWSLFEPIFKRRMGPTQSNPQFRSQYDDGLIGIRSLEFRPQDSLERWEFDEEKTGKMTHFIQMAPNSILKNPLERKIPKDRFLLFNARKIKDSPEGISALRSAYQPWYFKKQIEQIEAIGIERNLAGLPVIKVPSDLLRAANAGDKGAVDTLNRYRQTVRDLRFNEQSGLMLPSDPYINADGTYTNIRKVDVELVASQGKSAVDMEAVINRYDLSIARTMLADFLMLGSNDRGSYALSKSKADFFLSGLNGWLESIAKVINRDLIPKIWIWNHFDFKNMPFIKPGDIAPYDIESIGKYIKELSGAGMDVFPNERLSNYLLEKAGLPMNTPTKDDI